jgi:hypothetical protein
MLILKNFPTHIAKTSNIKAPNKYIKVNNQSIYNGALNRFARAIAIKNLHNWIINEFKKQELPTITKPVQLQIDIYTIINHGDISRRSGKIIWKEPIENYEPRWDEDNLRMIWEKCIKDSISILGIWPDDNAYWCRGTNSMVHFVDTLEEMRIEINFKEIELDLKNNFQLKEMKKAEEIYNEFTKDLPSGFRQMIYKIDKKILISRIKEIQKDAIEHTLKVAAERAQVEFDEGGVTEFVDEDSILSLKDELFKELE